MATITIDAPQEELYGPGYLWEFQVEAEAVAREHGHELGEWYTTDGLLTAARCTRCTATVCLRTHGSNGAPMRFLAARPCQPTERYFVTKCKANGIVHYVRDRKRPAYGPVFMHKGAAKANAECKRLNAGAGPVDELAKLRAKVDRLRAQLRKAEVALAAAA